MQGLRSQSVVSGQVNHLSSFKRLSQPRLAWRDEPTIINDRSKDIRVEKYCYFNNVKSRSCLFNLSSVITDQS